MTEVPPFSRTEVLEGFPSRRASTLLYLIENRTAFLLSQSRQAMERFLTEEVAHERSLAYLEAFAVGREAPLRPGIVDLERFAPQWAPLVPENPRVRAALVRRIGAKYRPPLQQTPQLQAALGLDDPEVRQAYERLYHTPPTELFATRAPARERLRWLHSALGARLESLSPFWTAYALTLTETVGAGILALPIAVASVGPLAGVLILVVIGLVNVLTIMSMSEAVARSGTIRYGSAFIGRAVTAYLGRTGGALLTLALVTTCFVALLAYYIGFAATLAAATPVPATFWVALLSGAGLYFVARESLDFTVASSLLIGAVNILLILVLSLLALLHLRLENLTYLNLPLLGGQGFDASLIALVFGVVLVSYFGHLSVSNCARVVLKRDPSARSLLWGTGAAQLTAITLYAVWVLAANSVVAPEVMASETGTALTPMAREVGPSILVFGAVFVVLGMGMASIHYSLGLFNLVRERLPKPAVPVLTMPRQRATLELRPRGRPEGEPRLTLTYLGLDGDRARLRLEIVLAGRTAQEEIHLRGRWEISALKDPLAALAVRGVTLGLELIDALPETLRLRVESSLAPAYRGDWDQAGLLTLDLLQLPEPQGKVLRWVVRQGEVGPADAAAFLGWEEGAARELLNEYADAGLVQRLEDGRAPRYRAKLGTRRTRRLPESIWQAIGPSAAEDAPAPPRAAPAALSESAAAGTHLGARSRFLLSVTPQILLFLLVELLFLTGRENFAKPLAVLGVITISLLAGIFPVLLLAASRRRGEYVPGTVYRLLGHPLVLGGTYLLFLLALLLHGLVIWEDPWLRALALACAVFVLGFTVFVVRRGYFRPRLVLEFREEPGDEAPTFFALTDSGRPAPADVRFALAGEEHALSAAAGPAPPLSSLREATFHLRPGTARELKVWAHRVTPEGDSVGLPGRLEVTCDGQTRWFDLRFGAGQVLTPLSGAGCTVRLRPQEAAAAPQPAGAVEA